MPFVNFKQIFEKAPWFFLIPVLGVLVVIIVVILNLYWLEKESRSVFLPSNKKSPQNIKYAQVAPFGEEMATFSASPVTNFSQVCLDVSIYGANPWIGSYKNEKTDKFIDIYYQGKLQAVDENQSGGCEYTSLLVDDNGSTYRLNIPKGIVSSVKSVDLKWIDPQILGYHLGKIWFFRLRYQLPEQTLVSRETKIGKMKFIEWEIYFDKK